MCGRLEGRVAIVTGAAGYLGKFHCIHLAREGAKVVVTDIVDGETTVDAVEEEGGEALFMKLDVTSWEEAQCVAEETVKRFGRIDILVNNAGLTANIMRPWTEFTPDDWDRKLAVDVKGSFLCGRAVFPTMKEQRYMARSSTSPRRSCCGPVLWLPHPKRHRGPAVPARWPTSWEAHCYGRCPGSRAGRNPDHETSARADWPGNHRRSPDQHDPGTDGPPQTAPAAPIALRACHPSMAYELQAYYITRVSCS